MPTSAPTEPTVLAAEDWRELERRHQDRADAATRGRRERAGTENTHPVEDFLFTYYPFRPGLLRRWHPGANILLQGAAADERAAWKWYRVDGDDVIVDHAAFALKNSRSIRFIVSLLGRTAERAGNFGCFGLHEWAMVYRQGVHRHGSPLRLSQDDTDSVVETHRIACTHFDAFRFFTPAAVDLNSAQALPVLPSRENQPQLEQPGCLHAGMDVYKWAIKLGPLVPGELLLDCFDLARDIRELDMQASPYDLTAWGYRPVAIETPAGKAEYVRRQRGFTERSNTLRTRVIAAVDLSSDSSAGV
ncbi:3-methyladenine DNA glycosylase [Cryobacterium lactosi]|uniref:3-methyladenine DNA glycosylase n=1 Tax=Cryobacterium lactosi TaxID=1259202 RepID=A0A4R9BM30_9MICO|nr:3-methyladenine DNA glycosylase [Cryobacterium lactosi]TFD87209.1 3-methyladenine DNA glycosylase [Cryobacterium lactosi]